MKYVIIGYGSRGRTYDYLLDEFKDNKLTAVCDIKQSRIDLCKKNHVGEDIDYYLNDDEFFKAGKLGDLCVVSTLDETHIKHALAALNCGYDLILEKPIACNEEDCIKIYETATALNRKVTVCHVLRYAQPNLKTEAWNKPLSLRRLFSNTYSHIRYSRYCDTPRIRTDL